MSLRQRMFMYTPLVGVSLGLVLGVFFVGYEIGCRREQTRCFDTLVQQRDSCYSSFQEYRELTDGIVEETDILIEITKESQDIGSRCQAMLIECQESANDLDKSIQKPYK
tara:strand:- start:535 stop:864 length:330 start_codon:yes stop_codon:yes gene_type:complete